jgi:hypothetical protein
MATDYLIIMGNVLERLRKEAVVAYFNIPYRNLSGRTEENHEMAGQSV